MSVISKLDQLDVRSRPDQARVIITLRGELDLATLDAVRAALDTAGSEQIVLDLRELTFIDSTGLTLLLEADRTARRTGGSFAIVDGSPAVARLLELVGLSAHFTRAQLR